jgi:hypothetical protein
MQVDYVRDFLRITNTLKLQISNDAARLSNSIIHNFYLRDRGTCLVQSISFFYVFYELLGQICLTPLELHVEYICS